MDVVSVTSRVFVCHRVLENGKRVSCFIDLSLRIVDLFHFLAASFILIFLLFGVNFDQRKKVPDYDFIVKKIWSLLLHPCMKKQSYMSLYHGILFFPMWRKQLPWISHQGVSPAHPQQFSFPEVESVEQHNGTQVWTKRLPSCKPVNLWLCRDTLWGNANIWEQRNGAWTCFWLMFHVVRKLNTEWSQLRWFDM